MYVARNRDVSLGLLDLELQQASQGDLCEPQILGPLRLELDDIRYVVAGPFLVTGVV